MIQLHTSLCTCHSSSSHHQGGMFALLLVSLSIGSPVVLEVHSRAFMIRSWWSYLIETVLKCMGTLIFLERLSWYSWVHSTVCQKNRYQAKPTKKLTRIIQKMWPHCCIILLPHNNLVVFSLKKQHSVYFTWPSTGHFSPHINVHRSHIIRTFIKITQSKAFIIICMVFYIISCDLCFV